MNIFDGEAFRPEQDVWIEDGRIRRVGEGLDVPADLPRVDGGGRTLVPGLIDGHVHTWGSTLNDALRFGVTTVLDQFSDPVLVAVKRPARAELARGDEADIFSAGMLATVAGGHGTQYGVPVEPVGSPDDAPAWVRARKAEGSDWIKIVWEDGSTFGMDLAALGRDTVGALITAAHAEGMPAVVPTLSVRATMGGDAMDGELLAAAGGVPVSSMQRESLAARFSGGDAERVSDGGDVAIENVRRLHAAGVRLIAGTDAPNPGTASGLSMHGELRLLQRAGLSSAEALAAATSTPAAIFGIGDRGRIDEGRIADLVLVDGDLEQDLSLSTRIVAIWKDGYRVERSVEEEEALAALPAPETTLIADFEAGVGAAFGAGWQATSDRLQGGSSTARLSAGHGALRVEGEVVASGFAFPWSGAIFFPGEQPMQPVDFSAREVLRFRTRSDGRTYSVMLFGGSAAATIPATVPFTAAPAWTEVEIPLARFPTATPGLIGGLAFVAQVPPAGAYAFELDDVEIR